MKYAPAPTSTVVLTNHWRSLAPLEPRSYSRASSMPSPMSSRLRGTPRREVLLGDALTVLRTVPDRSIDCVITSPPYYLLRNYQSSGQLGQEHDVHAYVDQLLNVSDELARVLTPTGSFWLNLGDSYSRHHQLGAPAKGLLLAPERVLLGLAEKGWVVRNKVVWAKPNPMPASVRDRLACSWEPLYLLVRSERYHFDLDAIRVPHTSVRRATPGATHPGKYGGKRPSWAGPLAGANDGLERAHRAGRVGHPLGKNPTDVWTLATAGYRGAHFATFPLRLIERPLLAAVPERVCVACTAPWRRTETALYAVCGCRADWRPGIVLDPFMGSGTVAVAAEAHDRDWLGIELNPDYRALALERIAAARRATTRPKEVITTTSKKEQER